MRCPRRAEIGSDLSMFKVPEDDHWSDDHCSWCGSQHPDSFLADVEAGVEIIPTDKTYKVYGKDRQKFYFLHFSEEQMLKFIELYNVKKMVIGYPGYFYTLPFFMKAKEN